MSIRLLPRLGLMVVMAIPEACGLWIEQRVQEELEQKGETGASLRSIGRKVAAEVEKYFEATVKPETISMKASRMNSVTNVTPTSTTSNNTENKKSNEIKRAKDGTLRGGKREGAGRKPKQEPEAVEYWTCQCGTENQEGLAFVCKGCGEPKHKDEVAANIPQKLSQKAVWKNVEQKLGRLIEYMMKNCEFPPPNDGITELTRGFIRQYTDELNSLVDDMG